jgi:16S rRNA C1402 N4-methylase RsmH
MGTRSGAESTGFLSLYKARRDCPCITNVAAAIAQEASKPFEAQRTELNDELQHLKRLLRAAKDTVEDLKTIVAVVDN